MFYKSFLKKLNIEFSDVHYYFIYLVSTRVAYISAV